MDNHQRYNGIQGEKGRCPLIHDARFSFRIKPGVTLAGVVVLMVILGMTSVLPGKSLYGQQAVRTTDPLMSGASVQWTTSQYNGPISIGDHSTSHWGAPHQDTQATETAEQLQRRQQQQQTIARGQAAFNRSCTQCHNAQRALSKNKSYSAWLTTVRRMAAKDDANVASADIVPIARYLALRDGAAQELAAGADADMDEPAGGTDGQATDAELEEDLGLNEGLGFNLSSTLSPLYRAASGGDDVVIENPGFFADAWVAMEFDRGGPLRGNVTMCTSCHNPRQGFTIELVEATATIDLMKAFLRELCPADSQTKARVKAGRFIVPFGAISGRSHPGAYRTLTNPLMFNMGRRVFGNVGPPREPVLPMPYADEGVNFDLSIPLPCDRNMTFDLYAINGLQEGFGPFGTFFVSRQHMDNNDLAAYGGRATVGGPHVRLGSSAMSGEYQATGSPQRRYEIFGLDATVRMREFMQFYFEYAIRDEDALIGQGKDYTYGIVTELEIQLLCNLNLLGRYDTLDYRDNFAPDVTLKRFTWGFNWIMPGGSSLIVNHEHWIFPDPQEAINVVGARWVTTF